MLRGHGNAGPGLAFPAGANELSVSGENKIWMGILFPVKETAGWPPSHLYLPRCVRRTLWHHRQHAQFCCQFLESRHNVSLIFRCPHSPAQCYMLHDSNPWTFWKRQNYGDTKRSMVTRDWGSVEKWRDGAQRMFGAMKILYVIF